MNPLLKGHDRSLYAYLGHFAKPKFLRQGHNDTPLPAPLADKANLMETMRQQREYSTPMDSGSFFQRILQQGGGKPIPLQ